MKEEQEEKGEGGFGEMMKKWREEGGKIFIFLYVLSQSRIRQKCLSTSYFLNHDLWTEILKSSASARGTKYTAHGKQSEGNPNDDDPNDWQK